VSAAGIHYLVFAFFLFSADAPADFFGQNPSFSRVAQASALPTLWGKQNKRSLARDYQMDQYKTSFLL